MYVDTWGKSYFQAEETARGKVPGKSLLGFLEKQRGDHCDLTRMWEGTPG